MVNRSGHQFFITGKKTRPWLFISPVQHFFKRNIMMLNHNLKIDFSEPGQQRQNHEKW